jgi:hypothetical protein
MENLGIDLANLDNILTKLELKRVKTGIAGQKILLVGIEGNNLNFEITISWKGEIMIEKFQGNISLNEFCKILNELEKEIKSLNL